MVIAKQKDMEQKRTTPEFITSDSTVLPGEYALWLKDIKTALSSGTVQDCRQGERRTAAILLAVGQGHRGHAHRRPLGQGRDETVESRPAGGIP